MDLKEYEQSDIWIEQVDAAHKAFGERTENGLLAIEFLIHDLERIKAGEIVFVKDTAQLCQCNNCGSVMVDENPNDQPAFEIPAGVKYMVRCKHEIYPDKEEFEFWGCPVCLSDDDLMDVTEISQLAV